MPAFVNNGKNAERRVVYECLSSNQLRERIDKDIGNVGSVLGVEVRDVHLYGIRN